MPEKPRYVVLLNGTQIYPCETLGEALLVASRTDGLVYEPLAITACERIHAEGTDDAAAND